MDWELICDVLTPFQIRSRRQGAFHFAHKLLLLEADSPDLPGNLYLASGGDGAGARFHFSLIVALGPWTGEAENYIELAPAPLAAVYNALSETKSALDTLDQVLAGVETDQEIVDAAGMYLNLPMFYLDESYRIQAMTQNVEFETDEEWQHMRSKGFLSPESALRMKESGDLDRLAAAEEAVVFSTPYFPYPSVDMNITCEGKFFGRLNLLCIRGKASQFLVAASKIIGAHLRRNALRGVKKPLGGPLLNMLGDLLSGVALSESLIGDRLEHLPEWKTGMFQVMTAHFETMRDGQVGPYYMQLLERLNLGQGVMSLIHDGRLVTVCHGAGEQELTTLVDRLEAFFQSQQIAGGVSNPFTRLGALQEYYRQAEMAWELGGGKQLSFYRTYMLHHILSYIPRERRTYLISPDLERLLEADQHQTLSLAATLEAYLACGCNLTRTAERLYIHKNTLLYRLHRIRELLRCDLTDGDERLLLELSFRLLDHAPD